jgi:hypothetical protein
MIVLHHKRILLPILLIFFCWGSAQAGSLEDCFALQAIPKDDPLIVPPTDAEIQACFIRAVVNSGNVPDCLFAPSPDVCVIGFADETKDPSAIKAYVDARFPDYQADKYDEYMADVTGHKELMVRERNDLLMTLAGSYLAASGDFNALDLFDSTYETYYRDQILLSSMGANVIGTGYAPRLDFCDNLSGGYLDNYYMQIGSETPEGSFAFNREFCEGVVAASRSLVYGDDRCGAELPDRLRLIGGLAEEEIAQAVTDCRAFRTDILAKLHSLAEAFAESEGKNLEELLYRWERTRTRVNPSESPTELYGGVGDFGFYPEPRFLGSFRKYTVTEGSITVQDKRVDSGKVHFDATFTADFDKPPEMMTPGETYHLTGTTSGSGFVSETAFWSSSGMRFEYGSTGGEIGGDTDAYTNLDFITDTASATFTAPTGSVGAQLTARAYIWNYNPCLVDWAYTFKKLELIDLILTKAQAKPLNLPYLKQYFDVIPTLADAINNIQFAAGIPRTGDQPRAGDLTGDGKAGVEDTIKILQSMAE